MIELEKPILKTGASGCIIIDKVISTITGFKVGDKLKLKCSKNRIIVTKIEE